MMRLSIYSILNAAIFSPLCVMFRLFLEQYAVIFSLFAVLFLDEALFLGAIFRF